MDRPGHLTLLGRQVDYWATVYRRTWRGSVVYSFVYPVLMLAAIGGLVGGFVDAGRPDLAPADSYFEFVAAGLLAGQMAQVAVQETLWPVKGRITWDKTYHAMVLTPLGVPHVVVGHLLFVLFRLTTTAAVFMGALGMTGVLRPGWQVLPVLGFQLLVGWVFAAGFFIVSASARSDSTMTVSYRVAFLPMFFFSGAFFPITTLAPVLQAAARLTPLWHGVEATRMLVTDAVEPRRIALHLAYLVGVGSVLTVAAVWALRRRIVT